MPRRLLRLFALSLSSLAPPRCRHCRAALLGHANPFLCPECATGTPWIRAGACRGCGYPAGPHADLGDSCLRCRGKRLNLTAAAAVTRYRLGAASLVRALKFRGETEIAPALAGMMAERLRQAAFGSIDLILPVPLHPDRRRQRGFDQARLIGAFLAREAGLPFAETQLERVRRTEPQTSLRREARRANMSGAFRAASSLAGLRLLLVDDVMTTGATMADCARACREAGAIRVYALVFAR